MLIAGELARPDWIARGRTTASGSGSGWAPAPADRLATTDVAAQDLGEPVVVQTLEHRRGLLVARDFGPPRGESLASSDWWHPDVAHQFAGFGAASPQEVAHACAATMAGGHNQKRIERNAPASEDHSPVPPTPSVFRSGHVLVEPMLPPDRSSPGAGRVTEPPSGDPVCRALVEGLQQRPAIGAVQAPGRPGDVIVSEVIERPLEPVVAREPRVRGESGVDGSVRGGSADVQRAPERELVWRDLDECVSRAPAISRVPSVEPESTTTISHGTVWARSTRTSPRSCLPCPDTLRSR